MPEAKVVAPEGDWAVVNAQTGRQVIWVLPSETVGQPISLAAYKEKTIQISGFLDDGDLEGSNDRGEDKEWFVLQDDETGRQLSAPGLYHVKINPLWIRPVNRRSERDVTFNVIATV